MLASTAFRNSRTLRLALTAALLGSILAIVPRPAFAVERGVRVDSETPELDPAPRTTDTTEPADESESGADGSRATPSAEPARLQASATDVDDFLLIGATFDSADLEDGLIRVQIDGVWEPWQPLTGLDGDHGPDDGSSEAANAQPASDPIWVGEGDGYELDLPADAADLEVHLVRETEARVRITDGTEEAGAHRMPTVYSRNAWGARRPKTNPEIATDVRLAAVHHTVNSNSYSPGSVPRMLRSVQAYHMDANGWNDIGYNFIVDRFGRTWEGRSRSTYEAVVGAHTKGSNYASTGVAWLGDGSHAGLTSSGHEAIAQLIAWKLPLHGTFFSGRHIVGHRDRFPTSCPGNGVYGQLGSIRNRAVRLRPPPGPYLDVPNTAWNGPYIAWGKYIGITNGYPDGNFRPRESLTRAQLVSTLWGLVGRPRVNTRNGFTDVPRTSWLTRALDWAKENNVITGYPDGTFRGDNTVRRDSVAVMFWRWATSPVTTTPHGFRDIPAGGWADAALNWAADTDVVNGYPDGTYRPTRPVQRGQLLPMLYELRPFSDVAATAWHQPGAHWGFHQNISFGWPDRTFRANANVNRVQAMSMLWRTMDQPSTPAPPPHGWPDVPGGAWFEDALDWATAEGVVDGLPDGQFHGTDALLRHETALWIWRMAGSPAATTTHAFTDVPAGALYEDALNWAAEHGVVSGYADNTFRPDDAVSRAQWIMTLYRLATNPAAWVGGATPPTTTLF